MLADAEHTILTTAAERAAAHVQAAETFGGEAVPAHRTGPSAMERAKAAVSAYRMGAYGQARYAADLEALTTHKICVRSPALGRLIEEAIELKRAEKQRADDHTRAQVLEGALKSGGGSADEVAASDQAEAEAERIYMAARDELEEAACRVADAPFGDISDALARADAYARLVGTRDDGEPESDPDILEMRNSYRAALVEMEERSKVDGEDPFDEGESRLQSVEGKLTYLNRQWAEKWGALATVPKDADPELQGQIDEAYAEREAARTLMYAGTPRDVGQLLSLMEIAFDHIGSVDVRSYDARACILGADPVEERDMWEDKNDAHRRALALIATHAARLRDQTLPRDWQDLMASMSLIPNARDALWRAYDKGMDVQCLRTIQLRGHPVDQLPILVFDQPDGTYWIRPDAAFRGEAVQ